jgi:hypothetical protein
MDRRGRRIFTGYLIVGPEASVATTRQVLARHKVDLALLDVKLGGEAVFPVSEMFDAMGVPYIFVTDDPASSLPARYRGRPLVTKLCRPKALILRVAPLPARALIGV